MPKGEIPEEESTKSSYDPYTQLGSLGAPCFEKSNIPKAGVQHVRTRERPPFVSGFRVWGLQFCLGPRVWGQVFWVLVVPLQKSGILVGGYVYVAACILFSFRVLSLGLGV